MLETLTGTDENGYAKSSVFTDSTLTKVWLKERTSTVPYGYSSDSTTIGVTVKLGTYATAEVKNTPITTGIIIRKIDSITGNVLTGAEFSVYSSESCTEDTKIAGPKTNNPNLDNRIVFNIPIHYGTVYVKETKAPDGYELPTTVRP